MTRSRHDLRHIARLMVELAAPTADDAIFDPSRLCRNAKATERLNVRRADAQLRDALTPQRAADRDVFSLILAPLPLTGSVESKSVAKDVLRMVGGARTKRSELLCLALCLRLLKTGGRGVVLLPESAMYGITKAHQALRRALIEEQQLDAVIRLPAGVLRPHTESATIILAFAKSGTGTSAVWFYDVEADGYSLDTERVPLLAAEKLGPVPTATLAVEEHACNNLPDVLARWRERGGKERERSRDAQSFVVPRAEIEARGYDLNVASYRESAAESVPPRRPHELLAELAGLEADLFQGIRNLVGLLK